MMHDDLLRGLLARPDTDGRYYGVVVGVVTSNRDPDGMHRVKVRFPWLNQDDESNWARVATMMAGNGRGAYFLPEVDDEVLVAFEHGSVEHPFVIGSVWNGKDVAHESNADGNNDNRSIKSRSGHVVRLCDRSGQESIEIIDKTGHNRIVIQASGNTISIEAQGDIAIRSQTGKLTIEAVGVEIDSKAGVQIKAAETVDVTATAQMNLKAALINLN
ncbi:phage baseplate assembly protein V [Paraburkholderia sp. GAS334]|uniref:phage baseplate assembly protein V n=1 Tax=Paraburkholderia sp. GAS334 TaxID=3035131 RepID=UPI003D2528DF